MVELPRGDDEMDDDGLGGEADENGKNNTIVAPKGKGKAKAKPHRFTAVSDQQRIIKQKQLTREGGC